MVGRLKVFQPFFYSVEWYIDREVPYWPWFLKDYNSSLDPCSSSQNSTTILVYFGVVHQLSHVDFRKKLAQQKLMRHCGHCAKKFETASLEKNEFLINRNVAPNCASRFFPGRTPSPLKVQTAWRSCCTASALRRCR